MTATLAPQAATTRPDAEGTRPPAQRRAVRRGWRILLMIAAVVALVVDLVLAAPTLGSAVGALARASPWWIAAAVAAEALSLELFARKRRRLLGAAGLSVTARETVASIYVANAVHMTMPGGGAFSSAYVYRWMRERGASPAASTWTLAAGGLVSTSTLAALGVVASLLAGATSGLLVLGLDALVIAALVVAARSVRRRPDLPLVAGRAVLRGVNALLRRPRTTGVDALQRSVIQLHAVRPRPRDWAVAAGYGAGNWIFDIVCFVACTAAIGTTGLSLHVLLIAYTAGMAASGISLLPGGIGVVDTAMVLALVAGGLPVAAALPAVLLYRLISLIAVVAVGWAVAAVQAVRRRGAGWAVAEPATA